MKKILAAILIVFAFTGSSQAIIAAIIEGAEKAQEKAYQQFMMLKAVQQLKTLRDNYVSGLEYYNMMKRINEGKGLVANITDRVMDVGDEMARKIQSDFEYDWIDSRPENTAVNKFIQMKKKYIENKINYAAKVFKLSREAEVEAQKIANQADSLDSKSTQKAALKLQSLQLQVAAQHNALLAQQIDLGSRGFNLAMEDKERRLAEAALVENSLKMYEKNLREWINKEKHQ